MRSTASVTAAKSAKLVGDEAALVCISGTLDLGGVGQSAATAEDDGVAVPFLARGLK